MIFPPRRRDATRSGYQFRPTRPSQSHFLEDKANQFKFSIKSSFQGPIRPWNRKLEVASSFYAQMTRPCVTQLCHGHLNLAHFEPVWQLCFFTRATLPFRPTNGSSQVATRQSRERNARTTTGRSTHAAHASSPPLACPSPPTFACASARNTIKHGISTLFGPLP